MIVAAIVLIAMADQDDLNLNAMLQPVPGRVIVEGGRTIFDSPSVLQDPDRFVWGASVVKGDDGRFHMFYSTWPAGEDNPPFEDGWLLNSQIAYAVSDHPDRGFVFQKILLSGRAQSGDPGAWDAQSVHNPHVRQFDGRYYLYYIGARDPGPQQAGTPGAGLRTRDRVQQSQMIGVISADSIDDLVNGNWTRPDAPLLRPRTRVKAGEAIDPSPAGTKAAPDNLIAVNPSVVWRPSDGAYLLYFKGNIYDPEWRGVHGVAISSSPDGPFEAQDQFIFAVRLPDGRLASAEDPYVWRDPDRKVFFAVLKDFSGQITGAGPGLALMSSDDGLNWRPAVHPLASLKHLEFEDGSVLPVDRLERPQVLLNAIGQPTVLYLAVSAGPTLGDRRGDTVNVQISLED